MGKNKIQKCQKPRMWTINQQQRMKPRDETIMQQTIDQCVMYNDKKETICRSKETI